MGAEMAVWYCPNPIEAATDYFFDQLFSHISGNSFFTELAPLETNTVVSDSMLPGRSIALIPWPKFTSNIPLCPLVHVIGVFSTIFMA